MQYTSTMTSKGQVTVPAAIRKKLGLKPGQQVRFTALAGKVTLEQDDWRSELEVLGSEVREHMQTKGLRPLSDQDLNQARVEANEQAAEYRQG